MDPALLPLPGLGESKRIYQKEMLLTEVFVLKLKANCKTNSRLRACAIGVKKTFVIEPAYEILCSRPILADVSFHRFSDSVYLRCV